jgi:DNA (cytosine-5)-methyltransferase 1
VRRKDGREEDGYIYGDKSSRYYRDAVKAQGLPADFDLPGFTVAAKVKAIGNGVPLPMGRAVARAVRQALWLPIVERTAPDHSIQKGAK